MLSLQFFGFRPAMAVYGLCFFFVLMLYLLLRFNVSFIFEQEELEASSVSGLGCFRHVFSGFACAHHQLVFSGPIAWVLLMVAAWQSRRLVRQVCKFRNDISNQSQINACALPDCPRQSSAAACPGSSTRPRVTGARAHVK